jgi:hypothetical protein
MRVCFLTRKTKRKEINFFNEINFIKSHCLDINRCFKTSYKNETKRKSPKDKELNKHETFTLQTSKMFRNENRSIIEIGTVE